MAIGEVRAGADWLALREAADAEARARDLVVELRSCLPGGAPLRVLDLGCGTGSMARWLAPQLDGPQHWVMLDRDADLLAVATTNPPGAAADGEPVTVETRRRDITRLAPADLAGAGLVTASALLDMMTAGELERLLAICVEAGCPALITLSVTGQVELAPADPFDLTVAEAFNAHQRRTLGAGRLLGPDAVAAAVDGLTRRGVEVEVRPSPWRLGAGQAALAGEWLTGWLSAACEQRPELCGEAAEYARRRSAEAADGRLSVRVQHLDLLARPR
jgi:SAM-dependent methyltransferase